MIIIITHGGLMDRAVCPIMRQVTSYLQNARPFQKILGVHLRLVQINLWGKFVVDMTNRRGSGAKCQELQRPRAPTRKPRSRTLSKTDDYIKHGHTEKIQNGLAFGR